MKVSFFFFSFGCLLFYVFYERCCVVQIDCRSVSSEAFVRLAFPVLRDCFLKIVIVRTTKREEKKGEEDLVLWAWYFPRRDTHSLSHTRDQGVNEAAAKKVR